MNKSIEDQNHKLAVLELVYEELGSTNELTEKLIVFAKELLNQLHSE